MGERRDNPALFWDADAGEQRLQLSRTAAIAFSEDQQRFAEAFVGEDGGRGLFEGAGEGEALVGCELGELVQVRRAVGHPGEGGAPGDGDAQLRPLVPQFAYPPLVRNDLDEVRRLMRFLDTETTGSDTIVVLGSGPNFNQTTFLSARRSLRVAFDAEKRPVNLSSEW